MLTMDRNSPISATDRWAEIFDALSNPYRRQLLVALLDHNPQDDEDSDPLNIVADDEENKEILQSQMVHTHLPKLEEMGFIEWDREENRISTGPRWDDLAPILHLIEDHQDELPEGWL